MKKITTILFILSFALSSTLVAQLRPTNPSSDNKPSQPSAKKSSNILVLPDGPDTTIYNYFLIDDIQTKFVYEDTLLNRADVYNPANEIGNEHFTLGNLGSSAYAIRFLPQRQVGINYGYKQYDLYNFKLEDVKIFSTNRPLNDLYFSPLNGRDNFQVKSQFGRQYSDGISLQLNYRRINQDGFYIDQFTKTTNLSTSIFVDKKKYKSLITLLVNNNVENHNGGILIDTFYRYSLYQDRGVFPVNLAEAKTRKEQRIYAYNQQYNLRKSKETSIDLIHQIDYEKGRYLSSDDNVVSNSAFYNSFWVDNRGLRHTFSYRQIGNDFKIKLKKSALLQFSPGIRHRWHSIDNEFDTQKLNELTLHARLKSTIKTFDLDAFGEIGLADVAGDFNFDGNIELNTSLFSLSGKIQLYRFTPSLKSERLLINGQEIWQQDLLKPFGTGLHGTIVFPKFNLKASVKQLIETNTVYWDSFFNPKQIEQLISVTQFELEHHLQIKFLHLENNLLYQLTSAEELALPEFYINQRLYAQFKLFDKNLETQFGAENTYTSKFRAQTFLPLTGTFGNTDHEIMNFPQMNCFVSLKISQFRFFARFENFNSLWNIYPHYQIQNYPLFDFNFRLGVRWILSD